jgi:hypothetical protein
MISPELNVVRQMSKLLLVIGFVLGFAFSAPHIAQAQAIGSIHGRVMDPTGARVPDATVVFTQGSSSSETQSGKDGNFSFKSVTRGPIRSLLMLPDLLHIRRQRCWSVQGKPSISAFRSLSRWSSKTSLFQTRTAE